MRKRLATMAIAALGVTGAFAAPASADPIVTVCGSVQITVNGSDVVNNATCQVLPPEGN
jgi:type 1 fimbria pilin